MSTLQYRSSIARMAQEGEAFSIPALTVLITNCSASTATPDTLGELWPEVDAYVGRYSAGVQVPAGAHVVVDTYFLPRTKAGPRQHM